MLGRETVVQKEVIATSAVLDSNCLFETCPGETKYDNIHVRKLNCQMLTSRVLLKYIKNQLGTLEKVVIFFNFFGDKTGNEN